MMRRGVIGALAVLLAVGLLVVLPGGGSAQQKVVKIGLSLPITGADADGADVILKGAQMAIAEINEKGGVARLQARGGGLRQRDPGGRAVRPGAGGDQHPRSSSRTRWCSRRLARSHER